MSELAGAGSVMVTAPNGVSSWKSIALGGKRGLVRGVLKMNRDGLAWRSAGGQSVTVVGADLQGATWTRLGPGRNFQLRLDVKGGTSYRFDGFAAEDGDFFASFLSDHFSVAMAEETLSTKGWHWGQLAVNNGALKFHTRDKGANTLAFEVPVREISGATMGAGARGANEVLVALQQDDTTHGTDALVEIKLFCGPPTGEGAAAAKAHAAHLQAALGGGEAQEEAGEALVVLEEIPVLVPRGRFTLELGVHQLRLHGKMVHDYRVPYASVVRLFQLPRPDQHAMLFVLSLEPPIRHGHTTYNHVVMQLPEHEMTTLEGVAATGAQPTSQAVARLFKALTEKRITVPKTFKAKDGSRALKCAFRANDGYLYPLEHSFFFVHKPPTFVRFEEIANVEFHRVSSDATTRTFDLSVNLRGSSGQLQFKGLARDEYATLFTFLQHKGIRIANMDAMNAPLPEPDSDSDVGGRAAQAEARLKVRAALAADMEESDESDADFAANAANDEEESSDVSDEEAAEEVQPRRKRGREELNDGLELDDDYDEPSELSELERKLKKAKKGDGKSGSDSDEGAGEGDMDVEEVADFDD